MWMSNTVWENRHKPHKNVYLFQTLSCVFNRDKSNNIKIIIVLRSSLLQKPSVIMFAMSTFHVGSFAVNRTEKMATKHLQRVDTSSLHSARIQMADVKCWFPQI